MSVEFKLEGRIGATGGMFGLGLGVSIEITAGGDERYAFLSIRQAEAFAAELATAIAEAKSRKKNG